MNCGTEGTLLQDLSEIHLKSAAHKKHIVMDKILFDIELNLSSCILNNTIFVGTNFTQQQFENQANRKPFSVSETTQRQAIRYSGKCKI